ncbi:hypothetical protein [Algoriphagus antarcticus]|uniref:Uncharacterized protein n=1 Tax=Algoriphagus antarcticus TaxID=238540 RepID=A0A3E0DYJ5_9BACT|nr:hypothetical protein [Algoriphagus antarcticus]REG91025.1 hypothetical protein C8N25_105135 [Algoriphagus antarcticus]
MYSLRREIVLVNEIGNEQNCKQHKSHLDDNKCFVLDPVFLYSTLDWTKFEDDLDVLNSVYAMLFDEFVIARKRLLCYWPNEDFHDHGFIKLSEYCRASRINIEVGEVNHHLANEDKMLPEFEGLWKSFILFIVESLCEDVKVNEAIEDIGTLKCDSESVWIFSISENDMIHYSYLKSQVALFGFKSESDLSEMICSEDAVLFSSFNELVSSLQSEIDIKKFSANFSNSALEKQYYRAFCQNFQSSNLVQQWISTYSKN